MVESFSWPTKVGGNLRGLSPLPQSTCAGFYFNVALPGLSKLYVPYRPYQYFSLDRRFYNTVDMQIHGTMKFIVFQMYPKIYITIAIMLLLPAGIMWILDLLGPPLMHWWMTETPVRQIWNINNWHDRIFPAVHENHCGKHRMLQSMPGGGGAGGCITPWKITCFSIHQWKKFSVTLW